MSFVELFHKIGEKNMFIKCPKCQELIKDDAKMCPYCKYEITADEVRKVIREEEEEKRKYEKEMIEEAGRRRRGWLIFSISSVLVCPVITLVSLGLESKVAFGILFGAWILGILIFELGTKYSRCPYCDQHISARGYGELCPHCGGRLR